MSASPLEARRLQLVAVPAPRLDLAIVIPTYNECDNIALLVERLHTALRGRRWEAIFVDDDSPDGTADEVLRIASFDPSVRLIHRIGRRGLASACIEGMLSTSAPNVAVMDADLQHDESILPAMLDAIQSRDTVDLVVATRNAAGGSKGDFARHRVWLSDLGARLSAMCGVRISDPMSGFFMLRRTYLLEVVRKLSATGFKILFDLISSSPRELEIVEVPYRFGLRQHGESKLNLGTGVEYLFLLLEKLTGGLIPVRFAMFLLVGGLGLFVHLATLSFCFLFLHTGFLTGQAIATATAIASNFFLNNAITFRDSKLRGWRILRGLATFYLVCAFGALTNITVAQYVYLHSWPWVVAAVTGVVVSSVWNFTVSSAFAWQRKPC